MKQFCDVNSQYGAPMGRTEYNKPPTKARTVRLYEVRINQGYDDGGAYWGSGEPLYCAEAREDSTGLEQYRAFTRARNRWEAMKLLVPVNQ
jgi:hypothetical protein